MKTNPNYTKKQLPHIQKEFISYGNFKLTTTFYNREISIITNDTELIDQLSSNDEKELFRARITAIKKIRIEYRN